MDTTVTIFHFCKCQLWRGLQTIPGGVRAAITSQCGQVMSDINNVVTSSGYCICVSSVSAITHSARLSFTSPSMPRTARVYV